MQKFKAFLTRKNVRPSAKLYFVDAMGSMALGLFATLLIGTIFETLGSYTGWALLTEIAGYAKACTGAALGAAIGYTLQAPPLVLLSGAVAGMIGNGVGATFVLGEAGLQGSEVGSIALTAGPAGAFVVAIIAIELGKYMEVKVSEKLPPSKAELIEQIADVDVLIMRVDPKIDREVIDAAKALKVIGVCSVGLNHVDTKYCEEKGIKVFNAPGLNGNAVAELTISKMLDISRGTMVANHDVKVLKQWDKYKFNGRELRNKTLGVLGFGRIGQRVGEIARVFGMKVVAYDPYLPAEIFAKNEATSMSIAEVCEVADFVTIHMPLNEETKNLFNADSISKMKSDAVVLNMARGGIVNEKDMYEALVAGKIGGYATDVMENEVAGDGLTEGAGFDSPLFTCDNFIVSPHIGAQTVDAAYDIGQHIIAKVKGALDLK